MRFSVFLLVLAWVLPAAAAPIRIDAGAVPLDPRDPGVTSEGRLHYRGGLALTSPDRRFGGLSDLRVSPDGKSLLAIADVGHVLTASLVHDDRGDLIGIEAGDLSPLLDLDGRPVEGKRWGDAEGLAEAPDGGFLVSFERRHRIWRYPPGGGIPKEVPPPRELALAPANDGIETLLRLADGRLVAITEGFMTQRGTVGWLGDDAGRWSMITYEMDGYFKPTGATLLPDGDVLVLERRYTLIGGAAMRLMRIGKTAFQPDAGIKGEPVGGILPPLTVDNMEGISARRGPKGETLLYLISDNNFNPAQRTLLLMFELKP